MNENKKLALEAFEKGDYDQMAVYANKVCNVDGDYKTGIDLLGLGLAHAPFNVALRATRGRKYIGSYNYPSAVSDMSLASRLDPTDWEIWYYGGVAAYLADEYEMCKEFHNHARGLMLENGIEAIPATVDWYWMACMKLDQKEEAEAILDKYISEDDGGGSVLAPAMCVNVIGFISKLIEEDRVINKKANTDGIVAGNSIGFISRDRDIIYKAIKDSIGIEKADDCGLVYSDRKYEGIKSEVIEVMDNKEDRKPLTEYLIDILGKCDVFIVSEGPVDLEGFGDSLFGHFDERTKEIQMKANKGYVRVANIAGATAIALPQKGLGMSTLLMCESKKDKIAKLLKASEYIEDVKDELIERYFLDLDNYWMDGYEV
ncbi:MAG: hypothetical protein Q4D13_04565 [Erysipelotrichaceae bacterium]|nr:hypothetical protein [Erysipelotrichaceae bacterium]